MTNPNEIDPNGPIRITLEGPRGSGKSTIAAVIGGALEQAGQPVCFVQLRPEHSDPIPAINALGQNIRLDRGPNRLVEIAEVIADPHASDPTPDEKVSIVLPQTWTEKFFEALGAFLWDKTVPVTPFTKFVMDVMGIAGFALLVLSAMKACR